MHPFWLAVMSEMFAWQGAVADRKVRVVPTSVDAVPNGRPEARMKRVSRVVDLVPFE